MNQETSKLVGEVVAAAASEDAEALDATAQRLIAHLPAQPRAIAPELARQVLEGLRRNRRFGWMRRLAQAFIDDGCEDHRVVQHFAQALIEAGETLPAIRLLEGLVADPSISAFDWAEAKGGLGRAWKERALKARALRPSVSGKAVREAFDHYIGAWLRDRSNDYQGVNAVALAAWDRGSILSDKDRSIARSAAAEILNRLQKQPAERLQAWDYATASEALLGLDREAEAMDWYAEYARREHTAFALAGTVRQLTQLWEIGSRPGGNDLLAPMLGKLGTLPGGGFALSPKTLQEVSRVSEAMHEKVLGTAGALSFSWIQEGIAAARSVALIHKNGKPHGTGFVVRGGDLAPELGDDRLIVTNAHVVSDPPEGQAARPTDATVTFELLATSGSRTRHSVMEVLWQSPSNKHDVAVLRVDPPVPEKAGPLQLTQFLPVLTSDPPARVYVIGHPQGGELSFSFQDNLLLDYEIAVNSDPDCAEPCRIHYRAPTEPGSSGSPVFDASWRVIGVHHAGGKQMTRLNGKREVYPANEGLWIETMRRALRTRGSNPPAG